MVFCITFRCEEEAKEHQASQRAIADELEEKQARCVQLRAASEAFQGQLLEAEENKKKVGREIFLDKGLYFVRVHVPTTCVVPAVTWADTVWMVQVKFKLYVPWLKFYWNWGLWQWRNSQVIKVAFLHLGIHRYIAIHYTEGVSHTHFNWHVNLWISLIFEFYLDLPLAGNGWSVVTSSQAEVPQCSQGGQISSSVQVPRFTWDRVVQTTGEAAVFAGHNGQTREWLSFLYGPVKTCLHIPQVQTCRKPKASKGDWSSIA